MSFKNRSAEKELLDDPHIPFKDIKRNMYELNRINQLLGGHEVTRSGMLKFLNQWGYSRQLTICEIGCGGGDNLQAVKTWMEKQKIAARYIGVDLNPHCISYARSVFPNDTTEWICSDYREVDFTIRPDIIFSSLFCHHFSDEELVSMFQWLNKNAAMGFFINDLHRHPLAFYSIKWLTGLFSNSYLVKNDAPRSVKRGFKKKDWIQILQKAGIENFEIEWKWAFRWLLTVNRNG